MPPSTTTSNRRIRTEVWDEDAGGLAGNLLGAVCVPAATLLAPPAGRLTLALAPGGWDEDAKDSGGKSRGVLELWIAPAGAPLPDAVRGAPVRVHVLAAHALARADVATGASDPFVQLRWRDRLVAQTAVRARTLDPSWGASERHVVRVLEGDNGGGGAGGEGAADDRALEIEVARRPCVASGSSGVHSPSKNDRRAPRVDVWG